MASFLLCLLLLLVGMLCAGELRRVVSCMIIRVYIVNCSGNMANSTTRLRHCIRKWNEIISVRHHGPRPQ